MSNMQMREKLRKITQAASDSEQIPEHTKQAGMTVFFLLSVLGLFAMLVFLFSLIVYGHYIGAMITFIITSCIGYLLYKVKTADEIPKN